MVTTNTDSFAESMDSVEDSRETVHTVSVFVTHWKGVDACAQVLKLVERFNELNKANQLRPTMIRPEIRNVKLAIYQVDVTLHGRREEALEMGKNLLLYFTSNGFRAIKG